MTSATLPQQILQDVQSLSEPQQRQVLDYIRTLQKAPAKSGADLVKLAGTIPVDDLRLIERAIEEGCEQVGQHGR